MRRVAAFGVLLAAAATVFFARPVSADRHLEENFSERQEEVKRSEESLTQTYQKLRARLNESGQATLRVVERAWITFKENDLAIFTPLARATGDQIRLLAFQSFTSQQRKEELDSLTQDRMESETDHPRTAAEADQMLNNIYRECLAMLTPEKAAAFRSVQSQWIEFRDLHCRFDTGLRHGRPNDAVLRDLTMGRVCQLRFYMEVLLNNKLPPPPEGGDDPQALADQEMSRDGTQLDIFRFLH